MHPPRGPDFRGGGLDQPLQQVLAGAIRDARRHAGGGFRTAATQAARGEAQNQDRPQDLIAANIVGRRFAMRYQDTSERLAQYRRQISDLRGKIREMQQSVEPKEVGDYTFATRDGPVRLSQLFGDKASLFVIHNMGASCPYCTLWADGFNGFLPHIENRAASPSRRPTIRRRRRNSRHRAAGASAWCRIAIPPSPPTWAIGATTAGCRACPCS